jgi:uncharacterized protein (TIGR03067 family)
MGSNVSHGIVAQFLVQGFGSDQDFERRIAIEELVGRVLEAEDNGKSTGGDGGSGTMNAFFSVNDPRKARERVLKALRDAGQLDEGMVIVHETFHEDEEGEDDSEAEIWWPPDYAFRYTAFGPMWKGMPSQADLNGLSEGLRSLQGQWQVIRYESPDGSDTSAWASELCFLIARNQLVVRRQAAVISAARIHIAGPGEIDLHPVMGPNRGAVSLGRYELRGGELNFCMVPPNEDRPKDIAPKEQQQPGRMILRRKA